MNSTKVIFVENARNTGGDCALGSSCGLSAGCVLIASIHPQVR